MTDKELKKLKRPELLERLLVQTRRAERLAEENARLKERITERERQLAETGVLAATALKLAGTPVEGRAIQSLEALVAAAGTVAGETPPPAEEGGDAAPAAEAKPAPDAPGEDAPAAEEDEDPLIRTMPTGQQLEREVRRVKYRRRYAWSMKSTVYALITVAAVAVLVAVLVMPVLQIFGTSMQPTLFEGDLLVSLKNTKLETGDIVAFYYNNKILIKRVIGQAGQWIDLAENGTVYVDNVAIDEPYLAAGPAFGECDIELPYQVPENRIFVMGDNRAVSVDSRNTTVGCVAEEQIVGKLVFRVWPLNVIGPMR